MQELKPAKNTSFHLMVTLNDAQTGVVIPYASVGATITEGAKMWLKPHRVSSTFHWQPAS